MDRALAARADGHNAHRCARKALRTWMAAARLSRKVKILEDHGRRLRQRNILRRALLSWRHRLAIVRQEAQLM